MRERGDEGLQRAGLALHFDDQAGGIVEDVAGQAQSLREIVDERAEAHALHDPLRNANP